LFISENIELVYSVSRKPGNVTPQEVSISKSHLSFPTLLGDFPYWQDIGTSKFCLEKEFNYFGEIDPSMFKWRITRSSLRTGI